MLARETLTRSSLETQKLELMSEVANLKLRQTSLDRENMDLRKRLAKTLDLSTAATAALAAAANAAAASNQNHHLSNSTGNGQTGLAHFMSVGYKRRLITHFHLYLKVKFLPRLDRHR